MTSNHLQERAQVNADQVSHESSIGAALDKLVAGKPAELRNLQVEFYRLMSQRDPEVVSKLETERMERVGL
jgi:hypothetical protein